MKKLLGIVVLGLLLSSNAHADKIKKNGFLIPTNKWEDKIKIDETFKVNNPKSCLFSFKINNLTGLFIF